MAKPAGYIEASDGGLPFNYETARFVMLDMRLPVQPPEWTDETTLQRYRIQAHRQITLAAGTDTTEIWMGWDGTSDADVVSGAKNAEWIEYDATGQDPASPTGHSLGAVSFSSSSSEPRRSGPPMEAFLKYQADVADGELLAICLEAENDNAFNTSDPSSVRDYETIGRNTGTYAPYLKNESVNAWLLQSGIQNLNKILYATRQCWTVPL